ncbi:hypothetical protein [Sinorhizobium sojae]|uniref:hypothetical protein n=1 Tax=Sinorhizobium sojae TaxID=716925 RepID=UPI0004B380DF|nr:hypothetical protein [Sinorhizobium sojae]
MLNIEEIPISEPGCHTNVAFARSAVAWTTTPDGTNSYLDLSKRHEETRTARPHEQEIRRLNSGPAQRLLRIIFRTAM